MGINLLTGERTAATLEEDHAADDERAADLRRLDRATIADEPYTGGLVVSDNCALCGTAVEVHLPRSICPDCQSGS